jgi:shikimate kinase
MTMDDARPIALIGLMGAGKSSVARSLGERLAASVADLDSMIEAEEGHPISELFAARGEAWFRIRERMLLERVLASSVRIVACGGGVVLDPGARRLLGERCRVVWLRVSPAEAASRLAGETAGRPMLGAGPVLERLTSLLEARQPLYESTAHLTVDTSGLLPEEVADAVLAGLARDRNPAGGGPRA